MIKALIAAAIILICTLIFMVLGAHAAGYTMSRMICGNKVEMTKFVENKYGEKLKFDGLFPNGGGMLIYVNEATKTFTIFMDRDKDFCMVAAGSKWGIGGVKT